MRRFALLAALISLAGGALFAGEGAAVRPVPSGGKGGTAGSFGSEKIVVGGAEREYRLVVPKTVDPKKACPLVFAFHGLGDSKDLMPLYSRLSALARKKGFIIVYPQGRAKMWPLIPAWAKADLAFFDALYGLVTSRYNVDLNRVHIAGMSNGAYFCHIVASRRSDRVAAIAPHSGGLGLVDPRKLKLKRRYAVILVHGDSDPIVPVPESRRASELYEKAGHAVEYVEARDHGHIWAHRAGVNERIWEFFCEHPRTATAPEAAGKKER